jgi:hypothetical protein
MLADLLDLNEALVWTVDHFMSSEERALLIGHHVPTRLAGVLQARVVVEAVADEHSDFVAQAVAARVTALARRGRAVQLVIDDDVAAVG